MPTPAHRPPSRAPPPPTIRAIAGWTTNPRKPRSILRATPSPTRSRAAYPTSTRIIKQRNGCRWACNTPFEPGQLKPTASASGNWYASQAQLWILRSDLLFPRQWDALIELRRLSIRETDDHRLGFLLGGYRHVGDHLKIGAGYNFTNYSDNLADVSYRSHGFFVNMLGKF